MVGTHEVVTIPTVNLDPIIVRRIADEGAVGFRRGLAETWDDPRLFSGLHRGPAERHLCVLLFREGSG